MIIIVLLTQLLSLALTVFLFLNLRNDFRNRIKQTCVKIDISFTAEKMKDLAVATWNLKRHISKLSGELELGDRTRAVEGYIRRIENIYLSEGMTLEDYTGRKLIDGMNVDTVAVERTEGIRENRVKETVEPAVLYKGEIISRAKIVKEVAADRPEVNEKSISQG